MLQRIPEPQAVPNPLSLGEYVLLIDPKGKRYLIRLETGRSFHSHRGFLQLHDLVGQSEGCRIRSSLGQQFVVFRPTLADYVLHMKRFPQIVYPKDLGAILIQADIFPGAVVLEAGTGSGALTLALLRAVGSEGSVISYEIREDFALHAQKLIKNFSAMLVENLSLHCGDVCAHLGEYDLDRIILDLPEPWKVIPNAASALRPGGIILSYLPTILQVHQFTQNLRDSGTFGLIDTIEVFHRPWHVGSKSVRPAHWMVGHTGFITTARRVPQHDPTPLED